MDDGYPTQMPYKLLKEITDDFSDERIIGRGGFANVYMGLDNNGREIAVKLHHNFRGIDDKGFLRELNNLSKLKHQNIVQLVGFCNDKEEEPIEHDGREIIALRLHRALCFEYMPKGSLYKHLSEEYHGIDWNTRYKIIKGICEGLKYLHTGLEVPMYHLDLKPDNILLDENMVPKIAGFDLSGLFREETTERTLDSLGTFGYMPPEYINHQIISKEFDIFSLGVIIIKIMIGATGYQLISDMASGDFVEHVHNNWRERLIGMPSLEAHCQQVKRCAVIALKCLERDRHKRPSIEYIVRELNEIGEYIGLETGKLTLKYLRRITNNFSDDRKIGKGASGIVYKGVDDDNGKHIAVKKLIIQGAIDDKQFMNEAELLSTLRHQNIVKLEGYCNEAEPKFAHYNGREVLVSDMYVLICLEFLPNGSLDTYLKDASSELSWPQRYKIIKGICKGLHYLHEGGSSFAIIHRDLKPSNILLDHKMVPKIADFGISRLFGDEKTHMSTKICAGTIGYMAPEYYLENKISKESDVFSLGVIILEIITGERVHRRVNGKPNEKIVEAREKWQKSLQNAVSVDDDCQQIRECIAIGLQCTEEDLEKRPTTEQIMQRLRDIKRPNWQVISNVWPSEDQVVISQISSGSSGHLSVLPMQLCFQSDRNRPPSCSLHLTNSTDDHVAIRVLTNNHRRYLTRLPLRGIVPPKCTYTLAVTMREQKRQPASNSDEILTLQSCILHDEDLKNVDPDSMLVEYDKFFKTQEAVGNGVQKVTLAVACDPPKDSSSDQSIQSSVEIIADKNYRQVLSLDVHPTEPWILTSNRRGNVSIWNYNTQKTQHSLEISTEEEPVHSAKFIAREQWLVAADADGYILVYDYEPIEEVKRIDTHGRQVTSLAVHPTQSFVLSASEDHLIKLWDWENDWKHIQTFEGHCYSVTQAMFCPKDINSFVSASMDRTVKIWNRYSPKGNVTLDEHPDGVLCLHYFTCGNGQYLISGSSGGAAKIWDLETETCVHTLEGHANRLNAVYWHPEIPVLITGSLDGTVRVWNSTTYRLQKIIGFNLGGVNAFGYIKGLRRMVVGCEQGVAMMEIDFS